MSGAIAKHEMMIFSTEGQGESLKSSSWYEPEKHSIVMSNDDFEVVLDDDFFKKESVFVALSSGIFRKFVKHLAERIIEENLISKFQKYRPSLISFQDLSNSEERYIVDELFSEVIFNNRSNYTLLNKEELMFVLNLPRPERKERVIGVQVLEKLKKVKLLKGSFESLFVPMDVFSANSIGLQPDFTDIKIEEYGHYISFGEYEASFTGILYECDKEYRLKRRRERLESEVSFGACLRRYRIQKKMKQADFTSVGTKTIGRIEKGDIPTERIKNKILKEIGIDEAELLSF